MIKVIPTQNNVGTRQLCQLKPFVIVETSHTNLELQTKTFSRVIKVQKPRKIKWIMCNQ